MRYFVLLLLIPAALLAQTAQAGRGGNPQGGRGNAASTPPPPPTPTADLAAVEGQVFNALGGTPLRKVTIAMNRQNSGPMAPGSRSSYSATSDASGRFAISGIEPGTYRVNASHTGFLDMQYNARRPGGPGTSLELARAQRMTGVDFRLTPHGVVSGKVTDEDGDPIERVQMQLMHIVYNQGRKQLQQTNNQTTNDLGEYRFAGVIPGKYYLCATYRSQAMMEMQAMALLQSRMQNGAAPEVPEHDDYVPTFYPGVTDLSAAAPIEMGPGDQMQGVNLRLSKTRTVHVKGRVVNNAQPQPAQENIVTTPDGTVMPRVITGMPNQVHLQPRNALSPTSLGATTTTRPDGSFDFFSVAPGAYNLIATSSRGNRGHASRQSLDVGNANVEGLNVTINPGVTVSGHVRYDGDAPDPLPSLTVRLTPREQLPGMGIPQPAKVEADGSFRFDDVNPDFYNVMINTPQSLYLKAMRAGNTDVMLSGLDLGNGAGSLDILMGTNPPQVSGSVLNSATQQPAAAVTVVLVPLEKERQDQNYFYSTGNSDQYGNFTFSRVTPGEYKVYAWEDVQYGQWFDPDFMKIYDGKGEAVSAKEGSPVTVKLTMIPAK